MEPRPVGALGPLQDDLHRLPTHLYPDRLYGGPALPDRPVRGVRTTRRRGRLHGPLGLNRPGLPLQRVPVRAFVGPGGSGKTLRALGESYTGGHNWDPYLWSYRDISWVSARDDASLEAGLLKVLERLHPRGGAPSPGAGTGTPEDLVLDGLHARTSQWLLILDGLDDPDLLRRLQAPDGLLRQRMPRGPWPAVGEIVVTSRITARSAWGPWVSLTRAEPWNRETAVELLHAHTGAGVEQHAELAALAARLGRLPLALRLAGRHVHARAAADGSSPRTASPASRMPWTGCGGGMPAAPTLRSRPCRCCAG
ncbi:hypothetical protein ACFQ1I_45400 [Kitasatospora arboriphila]